MQLEVGDNKVEAPLGAPLDLGVAVRIGLIQETIVIHPDGALKSETRTQEDPLNGATPPPAEPPSPSPDGNTETLSLYRRIGRRASRLLHPVTLPFIRRFRDLAQEGVDASAANRRIIELSSQNDRLQHLARQIEAMLAEMRGEFLTNGAAQREHLQKAAERIEATLADVRAEVSAGTASQQERLTQATGAIGGDLAGLRAEMAELSAQQDRLWRAAGEIGAGLTGTRAEMAELAAQQERLTQATGVIAADMAGIRAEMAETAAQQGRLQQAAGQIGTDLAGMRAEITAMTQAGEKVAELASAAASGANELLQSRAVPIGAEVLTRTPFGWLLVPAEDTRLVAAMIETGGSLEPGTASVLGAILEPGDLAVDIGGHVGTLALAMARAVGPTGRVLVLEPTPRNADLLRRTAIMTSMEHVIQVEQVAAGAAEGRSTLFFGVTTGHNSLIPIGETPDSVEVDVKPLDALLPPDALPVLVKIDAEGAELEIWRGMSRLIADAPDLAVVVEFGPSHLARQGISIGEWLSTVTDPGFTAWEIEEETGLIRPLRRDGLGEIFSVNLLLLRTSPSRWPRLKVAQE